MEDAVSRSYPVMHSIFGSVRARVSMEPVTGSLRYFINVHIHLLVYLVKTCKFFKVNFRKIVELAVGGKYNQTHRIRVSFCGFRCFILAEKKSRPPWGGTRRPTGKSSTSSCHLPTRRPTVHPGVAHGNRGPVVVVWLMVLVFFCDRKGLGEGQPLRESLNNCWASCTKRNLKKGTQSQLEKFKPKIMRNVFSILRTQLIFENAAFLKILSPR